MLIVLVLYLVVLCFKLVCRGWSSGTVAVTIRLFIPAVFSALLNNLTPHVGVLRVDDQGKIGRCG